MNIIQFLMTCPIFAGVPESAFAEVADKFELRDYKDGASLYRTGEKVDYLYIVVEGKVRFDYRVPDGSEFILYLTNETLSCGEVEILNDFDAIASATTVGDVKLLQLAREYFFELLSREPLFGLSLSKLLSRHVHYSIVAANYHYFRDTEARLAKVLAQFATMFHEKPSPEGYRTLAVNLTHADLSNMVGTTRQTVSKLMTQWRDFGWLDYKYGKITIKDLAALKQHVQTVSTK